MDLLDLLVRLFALIGLGFVVLLVIFYLELL